MNMQEIRVVARDLGVKPGRLNKAQLIKAIQLEEGNFDCFASAASQQCDQYACLWRADCFDSARRVLT